MVVISLIFLVIIFLMVISLRDRVQRLECLLENSSRPSRRTESESSASQNQPATLSKLPDSLLSYVKQQVELGTSRVEIRNNLKANGWQDDMIDRVFEVVAFVPAGGFRREPLSGPGPIDGFIEWIKEDWLLKLGALLLLIGFGWLVTYAFLNNWIGPAGRISLGILAGVLFLLLGWWRIKKYLHQGGIFMVLGSTTILLTIYAAREIYGFFTPEIALLVMFLSTAFVALASVQHKSRALSLASLILAGVAPLLTSSPNADYVGLFAYLLVVILGAIWITAITGRRELTIASLAMIAAYSFPHLTGVIRGSQEELLMFAYAFAALFFVTNTFGVIKLKNEQIIPDLITAAGNGLFLLSWIMVAAQEEWQSLIISAWMLVFVAGAFSIFRITKRREPFYVYAGVGVAMLAAATSAELQGATLTIAYTIECAVISLTTYLVLKDVRIAERANLLLIGPILFSMGSLFSFSWHEGVIHKDFFVLLVLALTMLGLGIFFLKPAREGGDSGTKDLNVAVMIGGSLYAYALLWLSLQAGLANDNTAVTISLVIYTLIGLVAYFYGTVHEKKVLRVYGGVLVGFVVGRLLLIDIQQMELAAKIVTFFLIGALLISTAFLGKKKQAIQNN